ncbi:response regulator [Brevundimonas sp. SL130]|uniref:ATP-binding response regulator n=1 Tax=Brevundimonas sp. SL130 TaxID=2995143 RepID=UPI00226C7457|nr:response regulator [Brevundimonas sp. SL130]WAC58641.1 response regulator [Brevundimonas sp. SL130]
MTRAPACRRISASGSSNPSNNWPPVAPPGGAGLGLALCRASAQALGGALGVRGARPQDGAQGAVFWVRFAAEPAPCPTVQAADAGLAAQAPVEACPTLRVLAAEDHPANRKLLTLLFQAFGLDLVLVENGQEAVQAVAAERFDLVLMDVMMPVMDGVEALSAIRADEAATGRPRLPIHMLTANVFDEDVARYMAAGADGVLRKPIEPPALQAVLLGASRSIDA